VFPEGKQSGRHYTGEVWRPLLFGKLSLIALIVDEATQVIGA